MTKQVRVRYAPSPTGHLHIGNARTALFNYLFARHYKGQFVIRIEDTDRKRNVEGGDINQLKYLKWLGIDWDESIDKPGPYDPYRQSERLEIYQKYAQILMEKGLAYKCYCTEEELEAEREKQRAQGVMPRYSGKCRDLSPAEQEALEAKGRKPSIRFRVPENKSYTFDDMVKGPITFESNDIGDFVIVKKDGWPTYNFAVVIDDHLMDITHVLRGEDHISNTPRQMMIYEALGWEPPVFGHMTLIVNENRKKLSKRDETIIQFIEQYHELGYLPEALFNFITLLGWSPEGEREIFSREEFIRIFDEKRLSKSPAVFDANKLTWMNNHYIKQLSPDEVVKLALPYLQKEGYLPRDLTPEQQEWATKLILLYQEQLRYGAEITKLASLFFKEEIEHDDEAMAILGEEQVPAVLQAFLEQLDQADPFEPEQIKQALKSVQKMTGAKGKKLFMPIRVACTGQSHGPDLTQSLALLGRDKVRSRLQEALKKLQTV
ncbi:glutamate--tRNA ligase [Caldalkalibacillus thermarum TA2.A1]|uniref:Glutamate--tRNA ligase n=1 Tax=Caldalkalibacillus thermarum (strain TA2.A1) TaxID=986075 RepID=A0A8X8L917_CALTT|nr:glutamate--tRNA ligase [Caldalkalibacillus thermarum]QZT35272.1 glutamate--tRNA ligase [Caldalkalibacillus thermarum TA2.A1]